MGNQKLEDFSIFPAGFTYFSAGSTREKISGDLGRTEAGCSMESYQVIAEYTRPGKLLHVGDLVFFSGYNMI